MLRLHGLCSGGFVQDAQKAIELISDPSEILSVKAAPTL
jgi:hypothetical protein